LSTLYCGCDPEADHACERHAKPALPIFDLEPVQTNRKAYPLITGLFDYFPKALLEVSHVSYVGNDQHNPGQPLHWDRAKSQDDIDAFGRHFLESRSKTFDTDGVRYLAKCAWRLLAYLEKELEQEGK
jgi:hypothetical protein